MQSRFDSCLSRLLAGVPDAGKKPVLLAVSGGIDSMCMAELFRHALSYPDFAVAHCNFRLRGKESDSDEALVRSWAEKNGVPFHSRHFDTAAYAAAEGVSIEMAARELRYRWFSELAAEKGYCCVAVAHNANDNAETLFLNLLRGTGIKGMTGMEESGFIPFTGNGLPPVPLIRPLLHFTRRQIEGYVMSRGICYHEDSTNAGTEYKRNKIRNQVFPVFSAINPSFVKTVGHAMEYLSEVCDVADDYYEEHRGEVIYAEDADGCRMDIRKLRSLKHWRYMLYRLLEPYGFNSQTVRSLSRVLAESDTVGGKRFFSDGYELFTSSDRIAVRKAVLSPVRQFTPQQVPVRPFPGTISLSGAEPVMIVRGKGNYFFNGISFSVDVRSRSDFKTLRQPQGVLILDKDKADFPLMLRRWLPGDWIVPFGMRGRKKISDLFTDLRYGQIEKEQAVMLVKPPPASSSVAGDEPEHHVIAVAGVRIDDSVKVTGRTENVIVLSINAG